MGRREASFAIAVALLATPGLARADEPELDWGGRVEADLRFRTAPVSRGDFYDAMILPAGVEREQNTLGLKLDASYGRFSAVGAVDFVLFGYPATLEGAGALSSTEAVQPYRFDVNALYVQAKDLLVDGLDLRIGQQLVLWGVGDQFNPTNNLNPDDLRDPLLFGKQQANFMVRADYWLTEDLSLSGVLVPLFRPALLPESAALGIASVDRLPFVDDALRHRVEAEQAAAAGELIGHPTVVSKVTTQLPDTSFENMQVAYRIAGTLGGQDVALSYYRGRTDFPQPLENHTRQNLGQRCDPLLPSRCMKGLLETDVTLHYPEMHVYGLNAAGEADLFGWISKAVRPIGYRIEAALIVPEEARMRIRQDALELAFPQPAAEYDYDDDGAPGGRSPRVVEPTPFLKWVVGVDYSFGEHVYANVQWVHGMIDEYGAGDWIHEGYSVRESGVTTDDGDTVFKCALPRDGKVCAREILRPRLGDYLAAGVDLKLANDAALLRLFTLWDLTGIVIEEWDEEAEQRVRTSHSPFSDEGFSMVIYPEARYSFGTGLELSAGALFQLGARHTKFGDPATGGSVVFTRAKYSF